MHCAEKKKHPRYLSALLLARKTELAPNEINFLREKLPQDIDKSFMFNIGQGSCENLMESSQDDPLAYVINGRQNAKEIFKVVNKLWHTMDKYKYKYFCKGGTIFIILNLQ